MSTDNIASFDPHGNRRSIFVSNADIRSFDIDMMSDFIGMGIKKFADALVVSETPPIVDVHSLDIPAAGEALSLGNWQSTSFTSMGSLVRVQYRPSKSQVEWPGIHFVTVKGTTASSHQRMSVGFNTASI